ncbi:tRNA lysidine(34) synthetase TilS [Blattabacterium cuenoti]|uniref:tRNA lysidine(34) synthetase TilS n=1 Tax=Blattabacterium cuenoti TaxID=1653831 RepID=UPI00163CAEEC|nr:tRNA lysidine(34) synthetase TilS [Blattabacterium cuenoti]
MITCNHFFLTLKKHFLLHEKAKICVALSGGLDSMVLINLLLSFSKVFSSIELEAAHCNFLLRNEESYKDEFFVKNFCVEKNIICHIKQFDTLKFSKKKKLSIQMAARKLRYDWFFELSKKNFYKYIILGHHLNDSIETFFINICRGTGIKGLLGIPEKNGIFLRPLSNFTKKEIMHYAKTKNIKWRPDKSNKETKYLRNEIRFFLSKFSSFSSLFYKGFKKTINHLCDENYLLEEKIKKICHEITIIKKENPFLWKMKCDKIKKLHPLSFYLFKLFSPYGFNNVDNLKYIINAQSGKHLLSKKYQIIKNRNDCILIYNKFLLENKNKSFFIYDIKNIDQTSLPFGISFFLNPNKKDAKKMFLVDFNKIIFPLLLRTWRNGDFFFPLNMNGKKKLSKHYKDKKFSILEKEQTWLLVNGDGNIILVIKDRLDNRFKISEKTKKILGIKI